jgi:hypothetical protein
MHVIKGYECLETNNITKCKFINMVDKIVGSVVSNDVHYCVKLCELLCQIVCTIFSDGVPYCVK